MHVCLQPLLSVARSHPLTLYCTGCYQERQELSSDFLMFAAFTLTAEDAKEYLYSFSTHQPVQRWQNIEVRLYI